MNIKIFVACHDDFYVPKCDCLYPIQVGTAISDKRLDVRFHDNTGENISEKNRSYCELTAMYWAWKNIDADYYGLFHYRRYLSFNVDHVKNNNHKYYRNYSFISQEAIREMHLSSEEIEETIKDYDIVVPVANYIGADYTNNYEQYCNSKYLHEKDLKTFLEVLKEKYPFLVSFADIYMNSKFAYFCNIGILKKQYYEEYCSILFDVLDETEKRCDVSNYSIDELRVFGHLSERLFGIMIKYWESKQVKLLRLRMANFDLNMPQKLKPAFNRNNIAIALASNNYYSCYLGVTIQSIIENSDKNYNYDIIILDGGILASNREQILSQIAGRKNISIRFYDARLLSGREILSTKQHMSVETWYRLYLSSILYGYNKVLYLDCDLVVNDSLVDLYNINLGNNILAGTRDLPLVGLYCDNHFVEYFTEKLKLSNPLNYVQAGVLLINLKQIRKEYSLEELLNLAVAMDYKWLDQDVMNILANGRSIILDQKWDVEINRKNIRIGQIRLCPSEYYLKYMGARKNPAIVHYSGEEKPWAMPELDMAYYFWKYARNSNFYELLLFRVMNAKSEASINTAKSIIDKKLSDKDRKFLEVRDHKAVTVTESKGKGSKVKFGKILPAGSKRRLFFKKLYYLFAKDKGPMPQKYWTIDSDVYMHAQILKRKIKKFIGLSLFDKEMKAIKSTKNRHKGERCFIVCTGPSLKIEDLDKLKNEYTFGVNSIVRAYEKTEWRPTYYVLVDSYAFGGYLQKTDITGNGLSKEESFLHYRVKLKNPTGNERYVLINYRNHEKDYLKKNKIKYSKDPSVCVYDCFTVTNMAIQLAIYMGFKEIYIIGADCNYNPAQMHFIETAEIDDKQRNAKYLPEALALSIKGYEKAEEFAEKHKVKIFNATRGGKLEVFDRVDFDTIDFK